MSDVPSEGGDFRAETRAWLLEHAPPRMRTPPTSLDEVCWGGQKGKYPDDVIQWRDTMAARGWTAPRWPREYGGGGLSKPEAAILAEEMLALNLRPPLVGFGLTMIGPLLLQEGSEALKKEHLPRIIRGEIRWCQGYSEPGSGSDLASLATKAERDGDDFVLNGSKIWTSYGEKADWMFILVRTNASGKKQDGITFLLMNMSTPGITVSPIRLISGASQFCQTFLADVRVPAANVVGEIDHGWAIARALLGHERNMIADLFKERGDSDRLQVLAREVLGADVHGRIQDPLLRDRIARLEIDQACFDDTLLRTRDAAAAGHKPGHESSIFKLYGTELNQRRRDLTVAVLGPQGVGWDGPGFTDGELGAARAWLRSRGNTIEGGTSEIQLNIIAKRVLGLPGVI
jgi:alkylation response protein AidB-like acyl-CoA dehydrogenase